MLAWDAASLRQRRAHGRDARGKRAEAHYRIVESFAETALVEVTLVTGKRNQIRVQAALRGHPLLGERQYRFDAPDEPSGLPRIDRQALRAWRLEAAQGKPAYTVANNKTLASIAARRPAGRPELIEISGVGPAFVGKYAEDVLALVAEHAPPLAA